jgi:phenylalanyl-tRNA synthetase alpha chain
MIPKGIQDKIGRNLYQQKNHPISIVKNLIFEHCFQHFYRAEGLDPIVTTWANFDSLLIPGDHPSRSKSDTYYVDEDHVLRTHTSAHQVELLRKGWRSFLVCGDVYRKDDIDATHYPVFHQLEGVHVCPNAIRGEEVVAELQARMVEMVHALFGPNAPFRFVPDHFPFTNPSFEMDVQHEGRWLEVAGCGVMRPEVLVAGGLDGNYPGWAFGLGLDRLAMALFKIPDIRLLWSQDRRFLDQFCEGVVSTFAPFSKHPSCYKDVSFWVSDRFNRNEALSMMRELAGDLLEQVEIRDIFEHPVTGRVSLLYRLYYRSFERTLTDEEVNPIQEAIRTMLVVRFGVELR